MKKCVLITGSTGFLGEKISKIFVENGWKVLIAGRGSNADIYMDFNKPSDITNIIIHDKKIDLCIHAAAANEVECEKNSVEAYNINCNGTNALAEFCIKNNIKRIFYLSTFHVFGSQVGNLDEKAEPIPKNQYGLTHYIAEQTLMMISRNKQISTTIIRLPNIIGAPVSWKNFRRWSLAQFDFCVDCQKNKTIKLNSQGLQIRNWISLDYVANELIRMADSSNIKSLYHLVGKDISILSLANIISETWEKLYNEKIKICVPKNNKNMSEIMNDRHFKTIRNTDNYEINFTTFVENVGNYLKLKGS